VRGSRSRGVLRSAIAIGLRRPYASKSRTWYIWIYAQKNKPTGRTSNFAMRAIATLRRCHWCHVCAPAVACHACSQAPQQHRSGGGGARQGRSGVRAWRQREQRRREAAGGERRMWQRRCTLHDSIIMRNVLDTFCPPHQLAWLELAHIVPVRFRCRCASASGASVDLRIQAQGQWASQVYLAAVLAAR